jgi:hypothetical protein
MTDDLDRLFGAQQRNMRDSMEQASRECSAHKSAERSITKAAQLAKRRETRGQKPEAERAGEAAEQRRTDTL